LYDGGESAIGIRIAVAYGTKLPERLTSGLNECPPSTQKGIPQSAKLGNKCAVLGPGVPVGCDRFLTAVETGTAALLWASHAISGV
jgi:hypothetical protein